MIADGAYSIYISGYHSSERRDVAYLRTPSPLGCHESEGPGRRRYSISKPPRCEEKHLSRIQQVTNTLDEALDEQMADLAGELASVIAAAHDTMRGKANGRGE